MEILVLERIFKSLNNAGVKYLVVGGLAVVAHGYVRFTADLDLFIQLEQNNLIKAMTVFQDFGYIPRAPVEIMDFIDADNREKWLHEKNITVFSLWNPAITTTEIDLFVEEPIDFKRALQRAVRFDFSNDIVIKVVGLVDLIQMKKLANRPKDLDDILQLKRINKSHER